jgi:hypothetical protein
VAAAAQLDTDVTLLTPPGGHAAAGPAYFWRAFTLAAADHPDVQVEMVLDVGGDGAAGIDALARGWRHLLFTGSAKVRAKLASAAGQVGGDVLARRPRALDLDEEAAPLRACQAWLKP